MSFLRRFFPRADPPAAVPESPPPQPRPVEPVPAAAGRELRQKALTMPADTLGFRPSDRFPRVFGAIVEWPIGEHTATLVALMDGSASLYTTSTLAIIGGGQHERVRIAAMAFVEAAQPYAAQGIPAADTPYPAPGRVRFWLRSFESLLAIDAEEHAVTSGRDRLSALFGAGQDVLTELRQLVG